MHYQPSTSASRQEIFKEIGIESFDELIASIHQTLRNPSVDVGEPLSEAEIQRHFSRLANNNRDSQNNLSFLGGGSYEHFIPAAVPSILGRHEFYTAYTPYQPEASQGSLQGIYEFQSLITELLDLDISNASHYDGATSMAEAALLAFRQTGRFKIAVARSVNPHYRQVLKTYLEGTPFKIVELPMSSSGGLQGEAFSEIINDELAGVIVQTPNYFGVMEDLNGFAERVHAAGALLILSVNPLSLGAYKSPGEWGADIAVGEGQPLGIPVHFGGPYLGLFAAKRDLMRKIPGRLAGLTKDAEGKRAFCLTLQAREQHIRRERAQSNICTNQALCALAATVYLTLLGKEGLKEIAAINIDRAAYLKQEISKLKGFSVNLNESNFNEFLVTTDKPFTEIEQRLLSENIFAGIDVSKNYGEMQGRFLVCATETKTQADLDQFVKALSTC